ncbi:hypothetical protein [Leyella lascolaii]|uniref:hypothetical protein n=1 Tax=Leyella lascolaii TaxID=1776379 RepID=UPI0025AE0969|nr:hypothetical protein [Leyella lascolaii]
MSIFFTSHSASTSDADRPGMTPKHNITDILRIPVSSPSHAFLPPYCIQVLSRHCPTHCKEGRENS